jgi:hypothetical protein
MQRNILDSNPHPNLPQMGEGVVDDKRYFYRQNRIKVPPPGGGI